MGGGISRERQWNVVGRDSEHDDVAVVVDVREDAVEERGFPANAIVEDHEVGGVNTGKK